MLAEARALVSERLGLAFPARRGDDLEHAFAERSLATLREQPTTGPDWRTLISELTVRESYFFRERAALEQVLGALVAERRRQRRLTLWSAGCAAGEEPYTLAMLLAGLVGDLDEWDVTILATDVDAAALEAARRGVYGEWALRETPAWVRRQHFRPAGPRRYELSRQIRAAVSFAPLNLATDGYPGSLDMIVCRNVLMYFTDAARERTVERLNAALAPGGRLVLSPLDASPVAPSDAPAPRRAARAAAAPRCRGSTRSCGRARRPIAGGSTPRGHCACRRCASGPLDADAHLLLAAVEEERGDLDAAIWALRRAIYSAPERPVAHFRLGGLLLRTGATEAGRSSLATAAALLVGHTARRARRRPDRRRGAGGGEGGVVTSQLDWERARRRLEAAQLALTEEPSPQDERALLSERARRALAPARRGSRRHRGGRCRGLLGLRRALRGRRRTRDRGVRDRRADAGAGHAGGPGRGRQPSRARARRSWTCAPSSSRAASRDGELTHAVAVQIDGLTFGIAAEAVEETSRERAGALLTVLDLEALAANGRLRIDDA